MKRGSLHSDVRVSRSIAPAAYTNNDTTTSGTGVRIGRDTAGIEALMTFDNTTDVLAGALAWEAWVEKSMDDGAGASDGVWVELTEDEYLGPATGLATPASGAGICLIDAPAEDNLEYRVGLRSTGAGYEWFRIRNKGIGNHANGNVIFGWFEHAPQERPVAIP